MELIKKTSRQLNFTLKEAWSNIIRSGWLAGLLITTMVASLSIFGIFFLLINDFGYIAKVIGSQQQVIVFLEKEADVEEIYENVYQIDFIKSIVIQTKEAAWLEMKKELNHNLNLDTLGEDNPLPNSLQIVVDDSDNIDFVVSEIKKLEGIEEIKYNQELVNYINQIMSLVKLAGLFITGILILSTLAIIANTIRLAVYSRKSDIEIMQLVGARNWIIKMPFIFEGVIFSICSAFFTAFILVLWRNFSLVQIKKFFPFIPTNNDFSLLISTIFYVFLISISVGFIGSFLSTQRYLSLNKQSD